MNPRAKLRRWHFVCLVASIPIAIGWTSSALRNPILWLCVVGTVAVMGFAIAGLVRAGRRRSSEDLVAEYASARGYGIGSIVFLGASVAGLIAAYATGRVEWGLTSIVGLAAFIGIISAHDRELKRMRSSQ